jgi:RNA polymerase sigma factor (sigma-70 family)
MDERRRSASAVPQPSASRARARGSDSAPTTVVVQRCLDELRLHPGEASAAPIVRELLAQAAHRLHVLCASLLKRSYPRLMRPPVLLEAEEMLGAVVERLLKALRAARPEGVRQFFALATLHMRWELNEWARRLDRRSAEVELLETPAAEPTSDEALASGTLQRILDAIEGLPDDEREVFSLVRIQGLTHGETAELLGVATKTIQRRLNRGLLLLAEQLGDLRAGGDAAASA